MILEGDLEAGVDVGAVPFGVSGSFGGGGTRGVECTAGAAGATSGLGDFVDSVREGPTV